MISLLSGAVYSFKNIKYERFWYNVLFRGCGCYIMLNKLIKYMKGWLSSQIMIS